MKIKLLALGIAVCINFLPVAKSQNLVLNPNFESVNVGNLMCSWYLSQAEFSAAINNWTCPTGGSTDVFSSTLATSCFCSTNSTHASAKGPQAPRSGNTYVPIVVYGSGGCTPYREYVQGQLSSPMIVGQQYCIEFYVSMADYNHYATNNIGVYFTTAPISNGSMCVYSVTPHVNYSGAPITNATGWTQLSFTFTPTQAYTNFTIGNFYTDAATTATVVSGSLTTCRYYVEDVSIQLCSSAPVITVNNATICPGESATLTASSSMGGTTYLWNTGATTSSIVVSPGTTTTYTVTGTSGGQTGSASATVTVLPAPTVTVSPSAPQICLGQSVNLTAGGASTYSWSGGLGTGATKTVSPLATTTYTVTGTSASGCTGTASVTVTVNPNPTVSITPSAPQICAGSSATITAGGANTYTWSGGLGTNAAQSVSPGTTTTYTVTGTSTAGCTGTASVTVIVNPNPTVSITPSAPQICAGSSATITAGGANSYNWSGGLGTNAVQTVSPGTTTTYTVTGTSAAGCTGTASVTVTVNPNPTVSITPSAPQICAGSSATITAGGANTYTWSGGLGTNAAQSVSPGTTTTYTVTGTSTAGCTGTASVTITVNPNPTVSITPSAPQICLGSSVTITAGGANTYSWSGGLGTNAAQTVSPATTTTYTVTGTNTSGCSGSASVTVTVTPGLNVSITPSSPALCLGESVLITANGGTTYSWSSGLGANPAQTVSPTTTTTYSVTATDGFGCTGTANVTVTVNPNPSVSITPSAPQICAGSSATITAGGANTYNWSGGLGTNAVQTVSPGTTTTYAVTGTNTAGCTGTASVTVTVNPNPTVSITPSAPQICAGSSTTITAGGASTYSWSGGLGTSAAQTVSPGSTTTYTVTGTNAQGCTGTASVTVTVNSNPVVSVTPNSQAICDGDSALITVTGADSYIWSGGLGTGTSQIIAPAVTTTYTVTGTDINGCSGTANAIVTVHPNPVVTAIADPDILCIGASTTITGGGASSYLWSNGSSSGVFSETPSQTTTYSVIGTDINGCTGTASVTVTVNPNLTVSVLPQDGEICEGDSIQLTASSNGSNPVFIWDTGQNGSVIIVTPPSTTNFTVNVTDVTGCTGSAEATVIVNPMPVVSFEAIPLSGCVPVSVHFSNMSDPGDYLWEFGDGNTSSSSEPDYQYSVPGSYTVTLTVEASGCENSLTYTDYVNVYPLPVAGFHPSSQYLSEDQSMVQFQDESMGASIWLWDFGTGDQSTNQNPSYVFNGSGEYTVWQYVENQWGCSDSTSMLITVTPVVTFYIPNAFSPNDDGRNDYFMPFGMNVEPEEFQMLIYDRWGMQIFRSDNLNTPWDGKTPEGNPIAQGTYVYVIKVKLSGKEKIFEGIVTVVY